MKHLTCYFDLGGSAGSAWQHLELFCLVHGVVSARHHQPVPRFPWAHIIHQVQDCAVHIGVNNYCELWFHWKTTMQNSVNLISKSLLLLFSSPRPLLGVPPKIMIFLMLKRKNKVYSSKHVFYRLWLGKQENRKAFFLSFRQVDFPLTPG